jgi:fibro-slime domain-containing protein
MRVSPCKGNGVTQTCTDACGQGTQTCSNGVWSACNVAPTRLACTNTCGTGSQACEKGAIKEDCQVEPLVFSCTNTCGAGTKLCKDNKMPTDCDVDPAYFPCTDSCGAGSKLCKDNKMAAVCEVDPVITPCSTICGPGTITCANNKQGTCTAPLPKEPKLSGILRDFHNDFPDMNHDGIYDQGIVTSQLGSDDKPVYAHSGPTDTVKGPDTFNQWFRDVSGINTPMAFDIPLTQSSHDKDVYTYTNTSFFPLDGKLFGNEGMTHNYSFTYEIATRFRYQGGESFTFTGDDDVFVYINRQLVIDIGGIHSPISQTVDLDLQARSLGLVKGEIYPMHIFFAERHPTGSDFMIETSISEFAACD